MVNEILKKAREKKGLSQSKLAGRIGIPSSAMNQIERGKRECWPKARRAISEILGVPESDLFPESTSGSPR